MSQSVAHRCLCSLVALPQPRSAASCAHSPLLVPVLCSALSAYMFYANAKRDEVKKENPEVTFGEVGGAGAGWEGGARWRVCVGGGARSLVAAQAWRMQYRESHRPSLHKQCLACELYVAKADGCVGPLPM